MFAFGWPSDLVVLRKNEEKKANFAEIKPRTLPSVAALRISELGSESERLRSIVSGNRCLNDVIILEGK